MAGENNLPPGGAPAPAAAAPAAPAAPAPAAAPDAMAQVGAALKHIAQLLETVVSQTAPAAAAPAAPAAEPAAAAAAPEGEDNAPGEPKPGDAEDEGMAPAVAKAEGAMDEDDDPEGAMDEDDPPDNKPLAASAQEGTPARGGPTPTGAMDAKSVQRYAQSIAAAAVKRERARSQAVAQARHDVRGVLGDVFAMDSASAIYREALAHVGIDPKDIPAGMARTAWQTYTQTAARAAGVRRPSEMAMDADAIGKQQSAVLAHLSRISVKG